MIVPLLLATVAANPASLPATLARAQPGDTIRLAPGSYGAVTIANRQWAQPITIDAGDARLSLTITRSSGIAIRGGVFAATEERLGYAARITQSSRIAFDGSQFRDSKRGMVIGRSREIAVRRATITGMTIDGINIASSQQVSITGSRCADFRRVDNAHPDCIQLWSRPATGVTSDVSLIGNTSTGNMQGFTAFNHVRKGVDDGGFDRIVIRDNVVEGLFPQGVAVYDCRNCIVRNNRTRRLSGARWKVNVNVVRCRQCDVGANDVGG